VNAPVEFEVGGDKVKAASPTFFEIFAGGEIVGEESA
jgi:hypothetical protein